MNKHAEAIKAFEEGRLADAIRLFQELLQEQETSELWNDLATVQLACGRSQEAESAYTRALQLDPQNHQAKSNLGVFLLSLGERARAIPLIRKSLPWLPEQQRELLLAQLDNEQKGDATRPMALPPKSLIRVLVIHDVFPCVQIDGLEPRLIQVLRALRKLGHEVTLIARDRRKRENTEPALSKLGIRVYAGDSERLRSLGQEIPPSDWTLEQVLSENEFAVAMLTQNFNRGISVPEHYLDAIRRQSPNTRIAILSDELHGKNAAARFEISQELKHREMALDWSQREREAFRRADLVIVPNQHDFESLRQGNGTSTADSTSDFAVAVCQIDDGKLARKELERQRRASIRAQDSLNVLKNQLANVLARATSLTPKSPARGPFSMTLVDAVYSRLLEETTGEQRVYARLDFYMQFTEQLLRNGKSYAARDQVRHIFGWLGDSIKLAPALAQPLSLLTRCYTELGDNVMAARCSEEARLCFSSAYSNAPPEPLSLIRKDPNQPLISLIVPSYNRLRILKKCLAALEAQTAASDLFEVIVIDDGSTDGTEEAMRQYEAPFRFQYLRQKNSGTGAARRNGVAHATGEYLLLMNDDTICNPEVVEQHLKAQHAFSSQRWAVLGNFEYPAAARQRALTHFFRVNPFMFPQVEMVEGCPYGYSHFITCNLSIRRDAVVKVGSFDATYKLSEDTEIGIRLFELGYGVIYHPKAHAWHDHLPYATGNLIRRARVYGADYFYMFRNHPRVMKEWGMPIRLSGMDQKNALRMRAYLEENRQEVEAAVVALERWDSVDFEPILANQRECTHVLGLFQQAVPAIHWFYLFESMLQTMAKELGSPQLAAFDQRASYATSSATR